MALREFSERCSHILSSDAEEMVALSPQSLNSLSVSSKSLKILKRQGEFSAESLTSDGVQVLITTSSKRDTAALSKFLATDVYAYGVLVSEVYCCGALPFDKLEDQALLTFLVESDKPISDYLDFKHTWASPPGVEQSLQAPEPLRVLTTPCVSRDPTLRPTFAAVAESLTALHTTWTSSPKTCATLTLDKDDRDDGDGYLNKDDGDNDGGYLDMEADIET